MTFVIFRHRVVFLGVCLTLVAFASCTAPQKHVGIVAKSPTRLKHAIPPRMAIASWDRTEGFSRASATLAPQQRRAQCDVGPGHELIVYASEGHVEPRTANVMQFTTTVVCVPSSIAVGDVLRLRWADYQSAEPMKPGEVVVSAYRNFFRQPPPKSGSIAGSITLLSRSGNVLRFGVDLKIMLEPVERRKQGFKLEREWEVISKPLYLKVRLRAYPEGAEEEVDVPRLGPHKRPVS